MTTMTDANAITATNLPLPNRRQGKARDVYMISADGSTPPRMVIIASDRISAFDVVLPTPIPGKGKLLTQISLKWFEKLRPHGIAADHVITDDVSTITELSPEQQQSIAGRTTIGRAAQVIPIEFVVRGYVAGSGWKDYQKTGAVCGVKLPAGLERCGKLPEPIFTPATKEDVGHDENIDFEKACAIAGEAVMTRLRDASLALYKAAAEHAETCGLILADTKFEFGYALGDDGLPTEEIILIDEIFTPDSSRYWPADKYQLGREQDSFDKQYVRNFLEEIVSSGKWDKTPPGPELPDDVVANTVAKYEEAMTRLFS